MSKNMILPLGIRDVDTNKNHRDECDNHENNNVFFVVVVEILRHSLQNFMLCSISDENIKLSLSVTIFNLEDVKSFLDFVSIPQNLFKLLLTFPFHHAVCRNSS